MSSGFIRRIQFKWIDRLVLALVGLFLLLLAVWVWSGAFNVWQAGGAALLFHHIGLGALQVIGVGLVLFCAGLHIVFLIVSEHANHFVRQQNELGHVSISMKVITDVVRRMVQNIDGIKDADVTVKPGKSGINVFVSLVVLPGPTVPNVTDRVSRSIAHAVQETVGVHVNDVIVSIKNIAPEET